MGEFTPGGRGGLLTGYQPVVQRLHFVLLGSKVGRGAGVEDAAGAGLVGRQVGVLHPAQQVVAGPAPPHAGLRDKAVAAQPFKVVVAQAAGVVGQHGGQGLLVEAPQQGRPAHGTLDRLLQPVQDAAGEPFHCLLLPGQLGDILYRQRAAAVPGVVPQVGCHLGQQGVAASQPLKGGRAPGRVIHPQPGQQVIAVAPAKDVQGLLAALALGKAGQLVPAADDHPQAG